VVIGMAAFGLKSEIQLIKKMFNTPPLIKCDSFYTDPKHTEEFEVRRIFAHNEASLGNVVDPKQGDLTRA